MIRAAIAFRNAGYGTPVLVGREDRIRATVSALGIPFPDGIEIRNARLSADSNRRYAEFLYARRQREGFLFRDCQRLVNTRPQRLRRLHAGDRRRGRAGHRRHPLLLGGAGGHPHRDRPGAGQVLFGLTLMLARVSGTVFIADTAIHERPGAAALADIAIAVRRRRAAPRARAARRLPVLLHLRRPQGLHPRLHPRGGEAARRARRRFRVRRRDGGRRRARPRRCGRTSTRSAASPARPTCW